MTAYIVRRLLLLPVIVTGVTILIFLMLTQLSPAQRAALYVADVPMRNPAAFEKLIEQYGLNDPMPEQYLRWIGSVARGNLGFSQTLKEPVALVIRHRFPATAELALWAILPIVVVGVQLGILAARRHNRLTDHVLRVFSIIGTSMPSFLAGLLLLMLFAAHLRWLPTGGRLTTEMQHVVDAPTWRAITDIYTVDSLINGRLDVFVDALRHLVLPIITLSYISWAVLLRVTRSSMLETLRQDYVRTARAKGLTEAVVVQKHARPNAMLPVVTVAGWQLVGLLSGVAITETIFNYPGMGRAFVRAAANLDVITVLGFVLFMGTLLIVGNLVVDFLYAYLDPRVRLT
jgi:peptide/nickel transport system permease protein